MKGSYSLLDRGTFIMPKENMCKPVPIQPPVMKPKNVIVASIDSTVEKLVYYRPSIEERGAPYYGGLT
jgi:hypothetical protein